MKKSSSFFVKHAQSGDEANCIHVTVQNMVLLNQNVIIYILFSYIFVSVKRTAQTSFRIFLQTRITMEDAKFNSHESGGHFNKSTFKNGCCKKNLHIFVTKLKLQVRLSIKSLHAYTLLMV